MKSLYHPTFMLDAILIKPFEFAQQTQIIERTLLLSELDKRVYSSEYVANDNITVTLKLIGGIDTLQRYYIDLNIVATFDLVCQRCLDSVVYQMDEKTRIVLFKNELDLEASSEQDEDLDGIVVKEEVDVLAWIEDQILLALPYAPRHEDCNNKDLDRVNLDKPNPFTGLVDKLK